MNYGRFSRAEYEALPDRQAMTGLPDPKLVYRDSAYPGSVFVPQGLSTFKGHRVGPDGNAEPIVEYSPRWDRYEWYCYGTEIYDEPSNEARLRTEHGHVLPFSMQDIFDRMVSCGPAVDEVAPEVPNNAATVPMSIRVHPRVKAFYQAHAEALGAASASALSAMVLHGVMMATKGRGAGAQSASTWVAVPSADVDVLREQVAVNVWQGQKIARLMKALRFIADHSNDPGLVREAEAALAHKDRADG